MHAHMYVYARGKKWYGIPSTIQMFPFRRLLHFAELSFFRSRKGFNELEGSVYVVLLVVVPVPRKSTRQVKYIVRLELTRASTISGSFAFYEKFKYIAFIVKKKKKI